MNSHPICAVEPPVLTSPSIWSTLPALALVLSLPVTSACLDVNGGAVELSWSLLTFEDQPIDGNCSGARIDQVRLHWAAAPDNPSEISGSADFSCAIRRGVTGFELDEGAYELWIEPICRDGQPADLRTYEVPAPIIRTVRRGQVSTLGSLLIVADDSTGFTAEQRMETNCTCCRESAAVRAGENRGP